jgi:hypothetical protein
MWEPQPLTTLRASKACRGENFTFLPYLEETEGEVMEGSREGYIYIPKTDTSKISTF